MPVYPGTPEVTFQKCATVENEGFAELNMTMCSHTGTHIDAPYHVLPDGKTLDQFPINKFVGPAILLDMTTKTEISLPQIEKYSEQISRAEFVVFRTGWQDKWNTSAYFEDFPTLTLGAAEWLANFDLKAIGFDAISVDKVADTHLPKHRIFLGREILIVENLANLDKVPQELFEFHCLPLNIANADGAPVRACAFFTQLD